MGLLVSILVTDILPIFAIASAGFLLARYASVDVKMLSRVVFYSLLPCLAFRLLVGSSASGPNVARLILLAVLIMGAMGLAAGKHKLRLPQDSAVDAEVDLANDGEGYFLQARLKVSLPGVPRDTAKAIVDAAHQTCPYSKATRGNIDVKIELV